MLHIYAHASIGVVYVQAKDPKGRSWYPQTCYGFKTAREAIKSYKRVNEIKGVARTHVIRA